MKINIINSIEFKYQDSEGRSRVELIDILKLIRKDKQQLIWSILNLQAVGDISKIWERGIVDLEKTIEDSPQGFILSWQILTKLALKFDDLIDIVLVGCHELAQIQPLCVDTDIYFASEIVLELIDSSVWRIYAKDKRLLQNLDHELNQFKMVASSAK